MKGNSITFLCFSFSKAVIKSVMKCTFVSALYLHCRFVQAGSVVPTQQWAPSPHHSVYPVCLFAHPPAPRSLVHISAPILRSIPGYPNMSADFETTKQPFPPLLYPL